MTGNIIEIRGETAIYTPASDIVASTASQVRKELKELVQAGVTNLTIDLRNVHLLDSTGIGCLVAAHNSLKKSGGKLHVAMASHDLYELFRSMRLDRHFTIHANRSEV